MNRSKVNLGVSLAISLALCSITSIAETGHQNDQKSEHNKTGTKYSPTYQREHSSTSKTSHKGHGAAWGYKGSKGPAQWGNLDSQYILCKTGTAQSPIDFRQTFKAGKVDLELDYQAVELAIENNGHTIKVTYPQDNYLHAADQTYKLLQFHYHAPSEHTENGRFHDMEIHFVHQNKNGALAVVGVFIDEGAENLALREIWAHLPKRTQPMHKISKEIINARDLIPEHSGFYRYMGSLTTPPCSEGVNWFVMKQPIYASKSQIKRFRDIMDGNNRPTLPVNQRLIMELD
jgi:carbonic anhydrase